MTTSTSATTGGTGELATMMAEQGYSMMPADWLLELCELASRVQEIPGAIVECGAYNGGSAAMLTAGAGMAPRPVYLFDSWQGLPPPGKFDSPRAHQRWQESGGRLNVGRMARVRWAFRKAGIDCELHLVRGWFSETIPATETGPIALLHVDADWYKCMRQGFALYERVVQGGLMIIHDYDCWPGARRAADELLARIHRSPEGRVAKVGIWWTRRGS